MSDVLTMPRLGETMEEGKIVGWLIEPGRAFKRGDPILEIETDKTVAELPALEDGVLAETLVGPGETVAVGTPIARLGGAGEGLETRAEPSPAPSEAADAASGQVLPAPEVARAAASEIAEPADDDRPLRATPVARRIAANAHLDLREVQGTGRRGRIEARDVERCLEERETPVPRLVGASTPRHTLDAVAFDRYGPAGAENRVLLLHGFAGDKATFGAFAARLARTGHEVVVPDLPAHGETRIEANTSSELAEPIEQFVRALGFAPTEIVAHSLGSVAAIHLAGALPAVQRLTLIAPVGLGLEVDREFVAGMAGGPTPGTLRHLLRRLTAKHYPMSDGAVAALAETLAAGRLEGLAQDIVGPQGQRLDIVERLRGLPKTCRVRIVFGLEDRIIPWTQVQAVPTSVAVHLVTAAGHMPHLDQPGEMLTLFED